jgi:hypothetical protein
MQEQSKHKEEILKIREDQIASLVATLLANKSELDAKQLHHVINKYPLPKEMKDKINAKKQKHDNDRKYKSSNLKKLRFENEDPDSDPELIQTSKGKGSKNSSMFNKAKIRRSKLVTPYAEEDNFENKLKYESSSEKIVESLESIPYSDDFEGSVAISKSKGFIKTRSEYDDDISEDYNEKADTIKDTVTERIGDDEYSEAFEDISESIHHSKSLKNKPKDYGTRLDSKYSASKIDEEDSIQEDFEESVPKSHEKEDELSSSSRKLIKDRQRKLPSKPDIGGKKPKKSHQRQLLDKLQDSSMHNLMDHITKGIESHYKEEYDKMVKDFSVSHITDLEFAQRKKALDSWKLKELNDIQKKKMLIEGWVQMSEIVSKMKEEESIGLSSGSIRDLRKAPKYLFTKPDFSKYKHEEKGSDGSEFNVDDKSDDSFTLRRAKKQLRDLSKHENIYDSADEDIVDETEIKIRQKSVNRDKKAADKLLKEKEKAIQDGLRARMVELEEKHAKSLLNEALKVNVKDEIERRYNLMLQLDEENKDLRRRNESLRHKRLEDSIEDSGLGISIKQSKLMDGSMDGSRNHLAQDSSRSTVSKSKGRNKHVLVTAKSRDDKVQDETIQEDFIQDELDDYSNDFGSISHSASAVDIIPLAKRIMEEKKVEEIKEVRDGESDIPSEINEDYSEEFEESIGSSRFSNNNKSLTKNKGKNVKDEIKEEDSDDEYDSAKKTGKLLKPLSDPILDSRSASIEDTPVESERSSYDDEVIRRIETGRSDDFLQKQITNSSSSYDAEVLEGSHPSVDWVMDIPILKPDVKKLKPIEEKKLQESEESKKKDDDIDEDYEDDFEDFSAASDKESTPRVENMDKEDDIMDDHDKLADIIAEELFKSIDTATGLFDRTKKIIPARDFTEADFSDKFPFAKPIEPKVDNKMDLKSQIEFFDGLVKEIMKPLNMREVIRKITEPRDLDLLEEFRKLRVADDEDDEILAGDEEHLINERIFKSVNSSQIRKIKGISDDKKKAIEHHNRALYISFNETFNKMIPSGLKQNSLSWVTKDQAFKNNEAYEQKSITENDVKKILKRVTKKLNEIINIPKDGKGK